MTVIMLGIVFLVVLAGCGEKSQKDVVSALDKKMQNLEGYKATATMTFKTSDKKQTYHVDIWYKKPSFYKVELKGENKENTQMIIRNKQGVFVLTPALNKSYRFESNWPNNRSQYYLYQSLAKDILNDSNRTFEVKNDQYVFQTNTNYQTKELAHQKITLSKKNLEPQAVQVMDKDMNVLIDIQFTKFTLNPQFDKNAFDVKTNMSGAKLEVPTMAMKNHPFEVYYPTYDLKGTKLETVKETNTNGQKKVVLKYSGKTPFTLVEMKSDVSQTDVPVMATGEPVDLGFTVGAMSQHALTWTYNGMDFFLASNDLSNDEMKAIAQTVNGKVSK